MSDTNLLGKFAVWVATGMGIGLVSPAPGTIGGLWGLPLAWAVLQLPFVGAQMWALLAIWLFGVVICSIAAKSLGGRKDPQSIVFDEIAALPIAYLGVANMNLATWMTGWLLFRLFDISKPPPTKQFEKLPSGLGIMSDDSIAAMEACAVLHVLIGVSNQLGWTWFAA